MNGIVVPLAAFLLSLAALRLSSGQASAAAFKEGPYPNVTGGFGIWQINPGGKIRLLQNSHVAGSPFVLNGNMDVVKGGNFIHSFAILNPSATVTLSNNSTLNLNKVIYSGGTITTSSGTIDDSSVSQSDTGGVIDHQKLITGYRVRYGGAHGAAGELDSAHGHPVDGAAEHPPH